MFSTDDDTDKAASASASSTIAPNSAPALATMDEPVAAAATTSTATDSPKSVVRNMNTGELREVKWVDPAMSANTNPFQMSWYV
jgi:Mg/Co/Ni transporter MgtE